MLVKKKNITQITGNEGQGLRITPILLLTLTLSLCVCGLARSILARGLLGGECRPIPVFGTGAGARTLALTRTHTRTQVVVVAVAVLVAVADVVVAGVALAATAAFAVAVVAVAARAVVAVAALARPLALARTRTRALALTRAPALALTLLALALAPADADGGVGLVLARAVHVGVLVAFFLVGFCALNFLIVTCDDATIFLKGCAPKLQSTLHLLPNSDFFSDFGLNCSIYFPFRFEVINAFPFSNLLPISD